MMVLDSGQKELKQMSDLAVEEGRVDRQSPERQRQKANGFRTDQRILGGNRRTQSLDELQ